MLPDNRCDIVAALDIDDSGIDSSSSAASHFLFWLGADTGPAKFEQSYTLSIRQLSWRILILT